MEGQGSFVWFIIWGKSTCSSSCVKVGEHLWIGISPFIFLEVLGGAPRLPGLPCKHLYPPIPLASPQWEGLEMAEGWLAGLRPQWLPDTSISSSCTLRNNVSPGMKKPSFVWPPNYQDVVPSQRVAGGCSSWAQPMPGSKACSLGTAWDSWSGSTAHLCPPSDPQAGYPQRI